LNVDDLPLEQGANTMPEVRGFSHLAISVEDLDRSLEFYCGLLGLKMFTRYDFGDFASADSAKKWSGSSASRSFALVFVAPPQPNVRTPFLSISDQPRSPPEKTEFWNWGLHHFGVWVDDFDGVLAKLEAAGTPIAAAPISGDSFNWALETGKKIRTVVVRDPDGNLVQLDEIVN
jgi:catechol 2,3-dioxygenase-like lactoylglutathione lyase family enzyme